MFISRLEMTGFKSFAARTTIEFRPGVMAVVGPNGCGKTNIVDAIRWVLGEQRTGALRAERMEAVIFNGTAKRRPVGMSEVTLTIENDRNILPTPYAQVEITRRLFRSGESEYLVNRSATRLRDIQDLFADTGFGHSTYSIIELQMVEGIISGPSEARRSLFEEAAGVAKFKSRRGAAERRLESTREALERLKDVYAEVEKSFHALKRQSGRARRYQSLSRALQLRLLANLARERLDLSARRAPVEARLRELEKVTSAAEADAAWLSAELLTLEAADIALEGKISRALESRRRIERREAESLGELALVQQRQTQAAADADAALGRRAELERSIERAARVEAESSAEATALAQRRDKIEAENSRLERESAAFAETVSKARRRLEEIRLTAGDLDRRLSMQSETAQRAQIARDRLVAALEIARRRSVELDRAIAEVVSHRDRANAELAAVESSVAAYADEHHKQGSALEEARRRHTRALSDAARARAEAEAARGTLAAHQSRGTFMKHLPIALQEVVKSGDLLTIAARVRCKAEHRASVAAAIKPILEAIDGGSLEEALALGGKLRKGEAAVIRTTGPRARPATISSLPEGCLSLSALIVGDGEVDEFVRGRLCDVVLAQDREALARDAAWAAERGVRLVTPDGEMLEPDGVLYAGALDPEAYRVGWQRVLKELEKAAATAGKASRSADELLKARQTDLVAAEKTDNSARAALRQAEDDLAQALRALAGLQDDLQQRRLLRQSAEAEVERLKLQLDSIPQGSGDDGEAPAELQQELLSSQQDRRKAEEQLQRLEAMQHRATEARTTAAAEAARTSERLAQALARIAVARQDGEAETQRLAELVARVATTEQERSRTAQAGEGIAAQLDLVRREKAAVTGDLQTAQSERAAVGTRKQAASAALKKGQELSKQAEGERTRLELETVTFRERLREIDRRLVEDASTQPDTVVPDTPARAEAELVELLLGELSLEQIRVRIQSLGPVNMLALDELEQVEERYKFLSDQKKDLEGGVELLTETIDRINHEARRRFRESFDRVDANFQQLFQTLFEGGEARITLEGGDPLEADIRIWATPTGKKLQGLSMLSGGEKALTAISLLFAIYMVRPSPFCILDEVDAPLDDVNIARFNRMIRRFSTDTQFLIVTHNKRTMEAADSLFGVTLGDDGASQLVSVRLQPGNGYPMGIGDAAAS